MLRDKIIERLTMTEVENIIEKIVNGQSITEEEAKTAYGGSYVEEKTENQILDIVKGLENKFSQNTQSQKNQVENNFNSKLDIFFEKYNC